jgi:hypothetical protein
VALLAAGLVVLSACGESKYRYVKSAEADTFFRLPSNWRVFEENEVLGNDPAQSPQARAADRARQWVVSFDSSPQPRVDNWETPGDHPSGLAQVVALDQDVRDVMSLKRLRASLTGGVDPIDAASQSDPNVEILALEDVARSGGLRGQHMVVNLRLASGQEFVTTNYLALTDNETRLMYVLLIGCRSSCYEQHKGEIEAIVDSWTVREQS